LFTRSGKLDLRRERSAAESAIKEFDVRARSADARMSELSGGNQQKAILARWLWRPTKVLLLDEPTHGVDVGAKARIYEIIRRMSAQGVSVIVASSELEELEGLCSRVLLLAEGRLVGEVSGADIDKGRMLAQLYKAMSEVERVA
jgi:ABC-type sugar transport system ATPase subunit